MEDKTKTFRECFKLVFNFFNKDAEKTLLWFYTKNPLLGNIKPIDLVRMNRSEKLKEFIENQLADND